MNTGAGECAVALLLMGHNTCIWTLTTKLWIPSLQFSSGEMGNLPFKHSLSASKWTLNITVTWTFWQSEQVALAELLSFRKHFHTSEAQWELTAELLTEVVVVAAMVGLRVLLCLLTAITWDMHKQEQPWPILAMWPPHTYEASVNNEAWVFVPPLLQIHKCNDRECAEHTAQWPYSYEHTHVLHPWAVCHTHTASQATANTTESYRS